jgi:hypothetical protein
MSHSSTSTSRTGCGCGGSSAVATRPGNAVGSAGGGCSCGGGCALCQGQDFARPRFFAGQLLTEDDLDLLASYVVEKNRLHNRSFFGEGVVCGLRVTCDPCGGGKVTVQPGYALDCCGNDVVVPCPQSLDVNALVKRLRIERTGGVDCGDPCSEQKAASAAKPAPAAASTDPAPPPLPPAEYCLYVRYCEQLADPVSPYATDDPCGAQSCEATRVREGFTFELRCRTCDEPAPDNLFSRIQACLGNLVTADQTARNTRSAMLYSANLAPALERLSSQQPAALFDAPRLEAVKEAQHRVEALPANAKDWTAADAYEAADTAQSLASIVAAWQAMKPADRRALENREEVESAVKTAGGGLARLARVTPEDKLASLVEDPLDGAVVATTARRALLWAKPDDAMKTVPAAERELLAGGVVYDKGVQTSLALSLARVKANLIDRLESRGALTDCTLLRDVRAIELPDDDPNRAANSAGATQANNASRRLVDVLLRYVRECICDALNPPCPSCDDPAVLLACLRIEGCDVVEICNLERTFVLTPVALRYWMPFLRSIGNALERLCCPGDRCDPPPRRREPAVPATEPSIAAFPRAYVEQRSALDLAGRWLAPSMPLDPDRIAAMLPRSLSFSPENARRLASAAAAVIDIASLRHGVPLLDLIAPSATPVVTLPAGDAAEPRPTVSPAPPGTVVDLGAMRADLDEMKKKLVLSDRKNRELESRLKKLEA